MNDGQWTKQPHATHEPRNTNRFCRDSVKSTQEQLLEAPVGSVTRIYGSYASVVDPSRGSQTPSEPSVTLSSYSATVTRHFELPVLPVLSWSREAQSKGLSRAGRGKRSRRKPRNLVQAASEIIRLLSGKRGAALPGTEAVANNGRPSIGVASNGRTYVGQISISATTGHPASKGSA